MKVINDLIKEHESYATQLAENTNQLRENVINLYYPPKGLTPAKGDGVTDDTSNIQAILDYAGANKKTVIIPNGTFLVTELTTGGCKNILGFGVNSIITSNISGNILSIDSDDTTIEKIKIQGNGGLNQIGIYNNGKFKCSVRECIFDNLQGVSGGGIYVLRVGTSQYGLHDGMYISNCFFYKCTHGIDCGVNAEYITINGCVFQNQCGWAIWTISGNTMINDCNIAKVQNGIYIEGTSNGGHSSIVGCNINHIFTDTSKSSGYALYFKDVNLGEVVTGTSIFDGNIMMINSRGINISNCILAIVMYTFNNSYGSTIENCYLYKEYGHGITNNNSHVNWYNNKTFDGLQGSPIEEIKGGQVIGTIKGQSITSGSGATTISVDAVSNSGNFPNQTKHPWWNPLTFKAKNLGYGGNRLNIDIQLYVTYPSGANVNMTIGFLYVGAKSYVLNRNEYSTNVYYSFTGEVIANPNDEVYIQLLNTSGQTATVTTTNGRFNIEGL